MQRNFMIPAIDLTAAGAAEYVGWKYGKVREKGRWVDLFNQ